MSAIGAGSLSAALGVVALALVPLALVTLTSFAKISVVFSALRNALGAPDVPSAAIVGALALALSVYVMAPVAEAVEAQSRAAREPEAIGSLLDAAREPLRGFLAAHAGEAETALLVELGARRATPARADDLSVLWASFALSELKEAFELGFFVYLPFLVLDLLVGYVLLALGVHGLSPSAVALPFKLLLFVAADGFVLVSRALLLGYA
ncbi:MAG: flagellar type III secretion system pore protein FliP [Polyangiales bacterium]